MQRSQNVGAAAEHVGRRWANRNGAVNADQRLVVAPEP